MSEKAATVACARCSCPATAHDEQFALRPCTICPCPSLKGDDDLAKRLEAVVKEAHRGLANGRDWLPYHAERVLQNIIDLAIGQQKTREEAGCPDCLLTPCRCDPPDALVIHNAAGPCWPRYHRGMPDGSRCRCGLLSEDS